MGIRWDPAIAVGVTLIDEQHQELFRRVNGLLDAMHRGEARSEIGQLLGFLTRYVVEHFGAEEQVMVRCRYPAMTLHRQQHDGFMKKLGELQARFDEGGATCDVSIALNRTVCSWLREHTGDADVALGRHLRAVAAREAAGGLQASRRP
jgi:hemerythrin-like metal-binding protein